MRKYFALILLMICGKCYSQIIPFGLSKDSINITELFAVYDNQSFYLYKPLNYNSNNSPIWFVMHGTGGTGAGSIGNLSSIADRRGALIIALTLDGLGTTMVSQSSLVHKYDTVSNCSYRYPGTLILNRVYNYISNREGRSNIPVYLSGFSSGGQFVNRYVLIRQAYPDSIPIKMSLSMSPVGYTFPTDTFQGIAQPWVCGLIMPTPLGVYCPNAFNIYTWNCNEHILQFYNENYAVCVGEQDLASQTNGGCYDVTGTTRLDRARTFYAFCDSNAFTRGTTLKWQYAEIPGAGHDEFTLFNTKYLPTDSSTIAESLLFDTPFQPVTFNAPVAQFSVDTTIVAANDTIFFSNSSLNSTNYSWDFGDSSTSNQANPFHIYTQPGLYTVELTAWNSTGCDSWNQRRHYILVTSGVGVVEFSDRNIIISPNPSTSIFELRGLKGNYRIYEIRNLIGQIIERKSLLDIDTEILDLGSFNDGLYLLSLVNRNGRLSTFKLVKN